MEGRRAMRERDLSAWPRYEAAVLGFREYWYPVAWARQVRSRPRSLTVLGDEIMLRREGGKIRAIQDRCPTEGSRCQ